MEIIVKPNYQELSITAARMLEEYIRKNPKAVIGLIAGSTPVGMYKELIRLHRDEGLDFSRTRAFNIDEYAGIRMNKSLPYEKDRSFERFMREEFFKHININFENTHIPDGISENIDESCRKFELEIRTAGGIDIQLLGIGLNGHIGFNEPGSSFDSRTRHVPLDEKTIDSNYKKFFSGTGITKEAMPRCAVTAGIGTILEARKIILLAGGSNKSQAIKNALEGPVDNNIPASALQLHKNLTVILDNAAASLLKRK